MGNIFRDNMQPFNTFFEGMMMEPFNAFSKMFSNNIRIDVKEDVNEYTVEAELAGFDKEDIKIDFDSGYLTISAEKNEGKDEETKNFIYKERSSNIVSRSISLKNADGENIRAKYNNGVLTVTVPKSSSGYSKSIEIE